MTKVASRWVLIAALTVLMAACGDDDSGSLIPDPTSGPSSSAAATVPTTTVPAAEVTTTTAAMNLEPCDPIAAEIEVGTPVDGETETRDQPPADADFYCLAIPDGLAGVTVTLSGLADDLDLYVGHPDLETVQSGGFDFWFSDQDGTADEVVTVPARVSTGFVVAGRYYIEVSGGFAGSPYTLLVETQEG